MGNGYWLDPRHQQAHLVTRHELWVLEGENARLAGISPEVHQLLCGLDPVKHQDEIRMAAIEVGMIRTRDHGNYISVQFSARPGEVGTKLWSVVQFLRMTGTHRYSDLRIDNFASLENVRISLEELESLLLGDKPIPWESRQSREDSQT